MIRRLKQEHRWGVILAGGEGVRLRPLTRLVCGDERPKQFCPLLGGSTLLGRTRLRVQKYIAARRILFAVTASHERFYREELADVPPGCLVVQPCNRGTLPAILLSLVRILRRDPQAIVMFFPSDHYYSDERNFMEGVMMACEAAEGASSPVAVLGVPARHAESGFGWIEAEAAPSDASGSVMLRVKRFWEKPTSRYAQSLLNRGCVWNTFVMVGRVHAFLELVASAAPALYRSFAAIEPEREADAVAALYGAIAAADFSAQVLSANAERLSLLSLGEVGWSDLGDPQRVIGALSRDGLDNPWLSLWRRQVASQPAPARASGAECA